MHYCLWDVPSTNVFSSFPWNSQNREHQNIDGMLLCCEKLANKVWDN